MSDPGFEAGVDGARIWPGGAPATLTTKAIDGKSSLEAVLPNDNASVWFESYVTNATGAVHATAKVRNDGAASASVKTCVGIYDQSWNMESSCTTLTLAPGAVVPIALEYVLASGSTANAATWYFEPVTGAATIAVDDAWFGFAAK